MKFGVVSFCNDGYPQDALEARLAACERDVRVPMVRAGLVKDRDSMQAKLRALDDADLIVVPCLAACGSGYAVDYLRRHFHKPIVLWFVGGVPEADGRMVTGAPAAGFTSLRYPLEKMGASKLLTLFADVGSAQAYFGELCAAMCARERLRETRIGMVGYTDLGFYTGMCDPVSIKAKFGAEIVHLSLLEIARRADEASQAQIQEFLRQVRQWSGRERFSQTDMERCARLYAALEWAVDAYKLTALSVKCFEGWTGSLGFTPCIPLSLLGERISTGCKCDIHAMLGSVILESLAGQPPAFVELYDCMDGGVLFANCGMTPTHHVEGRRALDRFTWGDVDGVIDASIRKTGQATALRIDKSNENEYFYHAAAAQTTRPSAWKELGWDDPAPAFPSIVLQTDAHAFLRNAPGQHYALAYGDYTNQIKRLFELI